MGDDEFVARFEDCTLAAGSFHHAGHVRMSFLYLCRYPVLEALDRFSASLIRFAAANGKPDRYHQTITWAFLFLVHERIVRAGRRQTWPEFAADNYDLLEWNDSILKRYYRDDTLASDLAKRVFVFPDRIAG